MQLFFRGADETSNLGQAQRTGKGDELALERGIGLDVADAEGGAVLANDGGGEDLGYVEGGRPGEARLVARELPIVVRVVFLDGSEHRAEASVVRGEGELPRVRSIVEIAEIAQGRLG